MMFLFFYKLYEGFIHMINVYENKEVESETDEEKEMFDESDENEQDVEE